MPVHNGHANWRAARGTFQGALLEPLSDGPKEG
jgi:hypothetical protein